MSTARYQLNKNKYLLDPEAEKLEHILLDFYQDDPRNCLLLSLLLRTGARVSEVLNLRKQDLNPFEHTVFIRGLKGSNDRELPLHEDFFKQLYTYASAQPEEQFFNISYNRLRQIWDLYRPAHKKLHCLRHTFAIRLYKKSKDLRLVQFALGHRNITNTMIYADYVYTQDELKKAILT